MFSLAIPALVPAPGGAVIALSQGGARRVGLEDARTLFRSGDVIVAHAAFVAGRLKVAPGKAPFDALELFAFVRPGVPLVPSALGLARALGLALPATPDDSARTLLVAAVALLRELAELNEAQRAQLRPLAATLARAGWRWGPAVMEAIGAPETALPPIAGLDAWNGLPKWEDDAPPAKPSSLPVSDIEARARLAQ